MTTLDNPPCSLAALAERYDAFLIDQWGVLHDGTRPYPGAVECLRRLRDSGKRVVVISNSGRREAPNSDRLRAMGFGPECHDRLLTSGEVVWRMLMEGDPFQTGTACTVGLLVTSSGGEDLVTGLPQRWTDDPDRADFVLLAGVDDSTDTERLKQQLARALQRGLPLLCANPDLQRLTPTGLGPGTGSYAQTYADRGGQVRFIGKPHPEIYQQALGEMPLLDRRRVVAIGDSLHHDVAGGQSVGIATILVTGGVHAPALAAAQAAGATLTAAVNGLAPDQPAPDWVIPALSW